LSALFSVHQAGCCCNTQWQLVICDRVLTVTVLWDVTSRSLVEIYCDLTQEVAEIRDNKQFLRVLQRHVREHWNFSMEMCLQADIMH